MCYDWCLFFVARRLLNLLVVGCLLCVACLLLSVACRSLFVVCCLLLVGCCPSLVVSYLFLMSDACCWLLFVVCCLLIVEFVSVVLMLFDAVCGWLLLFAVR